MSERYHEVAASIAESAGKVFKDFRLTYNKDTRVWCGSRAATWSHTFYIYFASFHVSIWGDVGDATLRITDHDSLAWFIRQGAQGEKYPDYFLSKMCAVEGDKRTFYVGDAMAYFEESIKQAVDEWNNCSHPGMTESDAKEAIADIVRGMQATHEKVKELFDDQMEFQCGDAASSWDYAWSEAGESDPPSMSNWSGSALWFWHIARTFARLYTVELAK